MKNRTKRNRRLVVNPFRSQAQRAWMYSQHPNMAKEWESHTPKGKLPKRVSNAKTRNPLKIDPTRTLTLRRAFAAELKRKFARLKGLVVKLIVDEDALGLKESGRPLTANTRWKFTTTPEQVKAFQEWLKTQLDSTLRGASDEQLWKAYAEAGYRKGAGRAFDDTNGLRRSLAAGDQRNLDFYEGSRDQFLRSAFGRPVSIEKVQLLAGRSFDELENVTADMSNRMSRELTDGLVEGKGPREIARDLNNAVDIGRERALVVARTEIIRCHAEGQLDALEALGVEEVGVAVEWNTTGDEKVCELCSELEGVILKIDEARNLLPRHPSCRCAWLPSGVGESDRGQKDSKASIESAVERSVEAETSDPDNSTWAGADLEVDMKRPESILNELIERELANDLIEYETRVNNGWVTLGDDSNNPGQHVFIDDEGNFRPEGPLTVPTAEAQPKYYTSKYNPEGTSKTPDSASSLKDSIRKAADKLLSQSEDGLVKIPDIRKALPKHDSHDFDQAIKELAKEGRHDLIGLSDPQRFTVEERSQTVPGVGEDFGWLAKRVKQPWEVGNANPNQPRDDHGQFAIHPGVGKLRELFGAKGIPHEHLTDLDLHDILSQASAVKVPEKKERVAKEPKPDAETKDISSHVEKLFSLKDRMESLAQDRSQFDALEAHIQSATKEVHETVAGLSHADLKGIGEAMGVIGAHRLGKGELVKKITGRVVSAAQGVLSIRQ